jgi:hypothetical protein
VLGDPDDVVEIDLAVRSAPVTGFTASGPDESHPQRFVRRSSGFFPGQEDASHFEKAHVPIAATQVEVRRSQQPRKDRSTEPGELGGDRVVQGQRCGGPRRNEPVILPLGQHRVADRLMEAQVGQAVPTRILQGREIRTRVTVPLERESGRNPFVSHVTRDFLDQVRFALEVPSPGGNADTHPIIGQLFGCEAERCESRPDRRAVWLESEQPP